MCSLLDCQLQTLSLSVEEEDRDDMLSYDNLSHDQSQHLLDQVTLQYIIHDLLNREPPQILCYKVTDGDTVSLYHQLSSLLEISWSLR